MSSTKHVNEHVPCGAAYKISCTDPAFYRDPVIITHHDGENVAERFLDSILHDARELREMLRYQKPMDPLTPRQQAAYDSPHAVCFICKKVTRYSSFYFWKDLQVFLGLPLSLIFFLKDRLRK